MNKFLLSICINLLFFIFIANAQVSEGRVNTAAVDQIVKEAMDKQHITGLSLAIIKNGKTTLVKGYGLANLEHNIAVTDQTVYKIGSVSKQIVATAIMTFVQANKLKLTDSLPLFFKGAPSSWDKITIRHLLNHTSGLPRESPAIDNMKEQSDSLLIRAAYNSQLQFEPGAKWSYCNLGYFMLADIIRQLSGQSFPDFMQNNIFRKYGLNSTRTTTTKAIVKNRAAGYVYRSADTIYNAVNYLSLRPSGAFISNIEDMVKWEMLLQSDQLLRKNFREQMWMDKVRVSNSNQEPIGYYGYGWDVSNYKSSRLVYHNGNMPGFTSGFFRFIDSNSAVIILTNADGVSPRAIAFQIADLMKF